MKKKECKPPRWTYPIGKYVRMLRKQSGVSGKQMAMMMGVTDVYWRYVENGNANPSPELIEKIALHFHADLDRLMILGGRLPKDIEQIVLNTPHAFEFLRKADREKWSLDVSGWTAVPDV